MTHPFHDDVVSTLPGTMMPTTGEVMGTVVTAMCARCGYPFAVSIPAW
jgi:exosome complex RNA-binding protein Csl4